MLFDIGEALLDETREYGTWADWLGIPRDSFRQYSAAVIGVGMDCQEMFRYFHKDSVSAWTLSVFGAPKQARPRQS